MTTGIAIAANKDSSPMVILSAFAESVFLPGGGLCLCQIFVTAQEWTRLSNLTPKRFFVVVYVTIRIYKIPGITELLFFQITYCVPIT